MIIAGYSTYKIFNKDKEKLFFNKLAEYRGLVVTGIHGFHLYSYSDFYGYIGTFLISKIKLGVHVIIKLKIVNFIKPF